MLTVLESIKLSTDYLEKKGVESPRINAELLLAHILKCKRMDLYLSFDRPLSEDEVKAYRSYLKRRGEFEPVQYIIGSVEFYGLSFNVNSSVLIPRPETEILVEEIVHQHSGINDLNILDIGTGSGNIAISLAVNIPGSIITATDISREALVLAEDNSRLNKTEKQIRFLQNDILKDELPPSSFDIIVSNPPYVSVRDYEKLKPELKFYEPRQALTDDSDGLIYYRIIASKAGEFLKPNGKLFFELGEGQFPDVEAILEKNNFSSITAKNDYLNIKRVITGELK